MPKQTNLHNYTSTMASHSTTKHYKHPEDVNVTEFVTIKLSGANYFVWKLMIYTLIEKHGMVHLIINDGKTAADGGDDEEDDNDEEEEEGEEEEDEENEDWERMDVIIRRWILSTVSENILLTIATFKTAMEMWHQLALRFSTPEAPTVHDNAQKLDGENLINRYLPLAKAAMHNDWEKAARFMEQEPDSIRANITSSSETALMIAVRSSGRIDFTRKLVNMMSAEDVALVNNVGSTALHLAARAGNMEAAELLVKKNPELPFTFNQLKLLPLHEAASNGKKEMVIYLISLATASNLPYDDEVGGRLLVLLISSGLYDVALSVVQQHPSSVKSQQGDNGPLAMLSRKYSAFPSGERFNFWQRIFYSCVPVNIENEEKQSSRSGDIENASTDLISVRHKLYQLFWKFAERSVPQIKSIRDKKLIHYQAQQLSKLLIGEIVKLDYSVARLAFEEPMIKAAVMGVHEVVEDILDMYPGAISFANGLKQSIFHLAAVNRCEKLFNIIYQFEDKSKFIFNTDEFGNTVMHLACRLEDHQKIKLRSTAAGAALQMQRELQWFKEAENLIGDTWKKEIDYDNKTAAMVFSETHQELVKEGEVWMKATANSCAIVAALIVTVVFAAAITVPGGNDSNGLPFFAKRKSFIVFAISDVLALFSSTSSLIMFLSILTSRYAEIDFLYALPKRLIIGLTTLFLSLIFMMIAFSASVEILFGDLKSWILVPVITLASIPITLFTTLQFSLLVDMIQSTYGSGIFGKQSDRIIY